MGVLSPSGNASLELDRAERRLPVLAIVTDALPNDGAACSAARDLHSNLPNLAGLPASSRGLPCPIPHRDNARLRVRRGCTPRRADFGAAQPHRNDARLRNRLGARSGGLALSADLERKPTWHAGSRTPPGRRARWRAPLASPGRQRDLATVRDSRHRSFAAITNRSCRHARAAVPCREAYGLGRTCVRHSSRSLGRMDEHPNDPHRVIYRAWEEHSFNLPPGRYRPHPDSSVAVWQSLWAEYAQRGPDELAIEDLSLLCYWGWTMAMERGDSAMALERLTPWFSREDRFQDDAPDWAALHACAIDCHLRSGEPDRAALAARVAFSHEQHRHRRTTALVLRNTLLQFGITQPDSADVPNGTAAIAEEVLTLLWPGQTSEDYGPPYNWRGLLTALSRTPPPGTRAPSA